MGAVTVAGAVGAGTVAVGCGASAGRPLALGPASALPLSPGSHVVEIVMENHELPDIIGSRDAPFINRLARSAALAVESYGIAHPSLPNYIALTSGGTSQITTDCTECSASAPSLAGQLTRAGIDWKAYMEDMPGPCFGGAFARGYAKKHDPFMYYADVVGDPRACGRVVPYSQLADDLRAGRLPAYAWISPNLCDDMHDCSVAAGDRWLAGVVPALERELGPRGFLVLTWDEGTSDLGCCGAAGGGGQIPTLFAGPQVRAGARVAVPIDHYAVLGGVQRALGVGLLGRAAEPGAAGIDAFFRVTPRDVLRAH